MGRLAFPRAVLGTDAVRTATLREPVLLEEVTMPAGRLSPLDASFLTVESPTAHMHVGWATAFEPPEERPAPSFEELIGHIGRRLSRAPRFRQTIRAVPLGLS